MIVVSSVPWFSVLLFFVYRIFGFVMSGMKRLDWRFSIFSSDRIMFSDRRFVGRRRVWPTIGTGDSPYKTDWKVVEGDGGRWRKRERKGDDRTDILKIISKFDHEPSKKRLWNIKPRSVLTPSWRLVLTRSMWPNTNIFSDNMWATIGKREREQKRYNDSFTAVSRDRQDR